MHSIAVDSPLVSSTADLNVTCPIFGQCLLPLLTGPSLMPGTVPCSPVCLVVSAPKVVQLISTCPTILLLSQGFFFWCATAKATLLPLT